VDAPDAETDEAAGEVAQDRHVKKETEQERQAESPPGVEGAGNNAPLDQRLKSLDDPRGPFAPPLHRGQVFQPDSAGPERPTSTFAATTASWIA
jgi:hypothetical protein